jgi:hypothetical protein
LRNTKPKDPIEVESLNVIIELLLDRGTGIEVLLCNNIQGADAREQIRRMIYFFADLSGEKEDYLRRYLNSPSLLDWVKWQDKNSHLQRFEKINLKAKIFHVLQEHFAGVRLPEGAERKDPRLYLTLSRRKSEVRQSAQIVLAELDWDDSVDLTLSSSENAVEEKRFDLLLKGKNKIEGVNLQLTVPFLDYVMMRHLGEQGEVIDAAYLERLDSYKAQVQKIASVTFKDKITIVCLTTDHSFHRQRLGVSERGLEVYDGF